MRTVILLLLLTVSTLAQTPKKDHAPQLVLPSCDTLNDSAFPEGATVACDSRHAPDLVVRLLNNLFYTDYPESSRCVCKSQDEKQCMEGLDYLSKWVASANWPKTEQTCLQVGMDWIPKRILRCPESGETCHYTDGTPIGDGWDTEIWPEEPLKLTLRIDTVIHDSAKMAYPSCSDAVNPDGSDPCAVSKPPKGWKFYCTITSQNDSACLIPPESAYKSLDEVSYDAYIARGYPVALRNSEGRWCEMHLDFSTCWEIPDQIPFGDPDCLKVKCHPMNLIDANDAYIAAPGYGMELLSDEGPEVPGQTAKGSVGQLHTCGEGMCGIVPDCLIGYARANFPHPCRMDLSDIVTDTSTPTIPSRCSTLHADGSFEDSPCGSKLMTYECFGGGHCAPVISPTISSDGHSRIATLTQDEQEELDAVKRKIAAAHGVNYPKPCIDGNGICYTSINIYALPDTYSIHDGYIFINVEGK